MVLNKREKLITWTLGIAVLLFVGDYYVVEPYFAARADIQTRQDHTNKELTTAHGLLENRRKVNDAWKMLMVAGLKTTAFEAEGSTLHALTDWAQASRVTIDTHKTDVPTQGADFQQVRISITAGGNMAGISRFLYDIETGPLPLQLNDVRIASRKDGTDDLTLQFTVTTLVFSPQAPTTKPVKKAAVNGDNI